MQYFGARKFLQVTQKKRLFFPLLLYDCQHFFVDLTLKKVLH